MISLDLLDNREIAGGFWLVVALAILLWNAHLRRCLLDFLKAFLVRNLLLFCGCALVYFAFVVFLLLRVGYWEPVFLKGTILWAILSGSVFIYHLVRSTGGENLFWNVVRDSLKVIVVIEFLVSSYSFSLIAEIILLPVLTVVSIFDAFARSDKQYAVVARMTSSILVLVGLIVVSQALWRALIDWESLATTLTLREFLLAPVLSMLLVPFIYLSQVYMLYESVFVRLSLSTSLESDCKLKRYVKRRIVLCCGLNPSRLRQFRGPSAYRLLQVTSKEDIDGLLNSMFS